MYQASNANYQLLSSTYNQNDKNNKQRFEYNNQQAIQNFQSQQANHFYQKSLVGANPNDLQVYTNDDSVSFALDEIGAIINSKDFQNIVDQKPNNEINFDQNNGVIQNQVRSQQQYQRTNPGYIQGLSTLEINQKFSDQSGQFTNLCHPKESVYIDTKPINNHQEQSIMEAQNNNLLNNINSDYVTPNKNNKSAPYVEIVEQPAKCSLRFRYKCEGRRAGSVPGVNSSADNKTFPSIRIVNYVGRAVVVISCVTKDKPYKPHPHNIVGKEGCKKGICTIVINNEPSTIRSFSNLGIQCVKRKDIEESLTLRESINVDPYRTGFAHKLSSSNIDLNVVRLCFQVFIEGSTPNKCDIPLSPIVSDAIHDKKAMSDLVITKLSHCSAPAIGGRDIILLCDRISKDDIRVRFFEERDGEEVWETYSDLSPADVHKQVAICFKTPKYRDEDITHAVKVFIQLERISDKQVSEPRPFQFLPHEKEEDMLMRKRRRIECYLNHNISQPLHHQQSHQINQQQHQHQQEPRVNTIVANLQLDQRQSDTSPSPRQPPRITPPPSSNQQYDSRQPTPNTTIQRSPESTPSPVNNQHLHQQQQTNRFLVDSRNLVVRREINYNDGRVMQLVDRPIHPEQQQVPNSNQPNPEALGSSLDKIDTAELMFLRLQ